MSRRDTPEDCGAFNNEVRQIWDQNAAWWDEKVGAGGDDFQRLLIGPATERLVGLQPDELVLDIACGNGAFSRRMAEMGARVVTFDFSECSLRAKARTTVHAERIEYRVLEATNLGALQDLGAQRFDATVCTMALVDIATIEPWARLSRNC